MNILRQSLVFLLSALLVALPVWSAPDVVGSAVVSQHAILENANLAPGATVFSGDSITVADKGDATLALTGGDQLDVLGGSGVRLDRDHAAVQMTVDHGVTIFRTVASSSFQALLGDATIRGFKGPAVGVFRLDSPDSALVAATTGKLSITTPHDGNTVVLNQGDAARLTLLPPLPQGKGPAPSGRGPFLTNKRLVIIAIIVGGGLLAGLLIVAHHEHKPIPVEEVTPFKL